MLYTFGYEGLDIDGFISRLKEVGVRTIVDVRQLPLSRKKGFSKRSFAEALENAGIAYVHWPMLGCPKNIRDSYKLNADWKKYTTSFNAYLRGQDASVRELAAVSRATTACLVCFEADYNFCHRTFVARAAHRRGAPAVAHITEQTVLADSPLRVAA
jgi:uncharacterized protein (DUF488 family)